MGRLEARLGGGQVRLHGSVQRCACSVEFNMELPFGECEWSGGSAMVWRSLLFDNLSTCVFFEVSGGCGSLLIF